ncbi:MAG TPA: hypothetical protein VN698_01480 [Bacteroidia bacterium]|nr:hypothetical protein [Bacteroidia bacterium]
MSFSKKSFVCLLLSLVFYTSVKAQLVTNLGEHHNQFFVGSGYSESFANITYGLNHTRYFKKLKRNIDGIIDFSSPLNAKYYTRFVFRKGFQFDVFKKNNFRLPLAIISSTVRKHLSLFDFHEIITEVCVLPGIYTNKFTVAADVAVDFLWFNKVHYNAAYYKDSINVKPNTNHQKVNVRAGVVLAYNFKRFSFIFKGGFQQINTWEFVKMPFYATGILAYKLNFRKHRETIAG